MTPQTFVGLSTPIPNTDTAVRTKLWAPFVTPERIAEEDRIAKHRAEQLAPIAKVERRKRTRNDATPDYEVDYRYDGARDDDYGDDYTD